MFSATSLLKLAGSPGRKQPVSNGLGSTWASMHVPAAPTVIFTTSVPPLETDRPLRDPPGSAAVGSRFSPRRRATGMPVAIASLVPEAGPRPRASETAYRAEAEPRPETICTRLSPPVKERCAPPGGIGLGAADAVESPVASPAADARVVDTVSAYPSKHRHIS